jgi:hypothetical protein
VLLCLLSSTTCQCGRTAIRTIRTTRATDGQTVPARLRRIYQYSSRSLRRRTHGGDSCWRRAPSVA